MPTKVKARIIEVTHEDLIDPLIEYYLQNDEYVYLTLRKEQMKGKYKKFKKLMTDGGGDDVKKEIERLLKLENVNEIDVEVYDDSILISDDESDHEYIYNDELDMYVNVLTKIGCNPDGWGSSETIFYTYVKIEK